MSSGRLFDERSLFVVYRQTDYTRQRSEHSMLNFSGPAPPHECTDAGKTGPGDRLDTRRPATPVILNCSEGR